MMMSTVLGFIFIAMVFMAFGIFSIIKPNLIGAELKWVKYKYIYLPKYEKSTNEYYHKQIKVVGVGLIGAAIIMIIISAGYFINPDIISLFK
ncbi:hypothetical protein ACQPU1_17115 [Clostridium paraputrificum]|uniref:hypothetical protein n=1 Tax=Clostridium TaxID=1485 RepID=UPI003D333690